MLSILFFAGILSAQSDDTNAVQQDTATNEQVNPKVFTPNETAPEANPDIFGIYTETLPMTVAWNSNVTKEIWRGLTLEEVKKGAGEGYYYWKLTSTGQTWMGMAVKPLPAKTCLDMSVFSNGSLNFMYKGTNGFKVGIKSGTNDEAWIPSSHLRDFGFSDDGAWHEIVIPLTAFKGVGLTNISYFFMFSSDSSRGMLPGSVYSIDNIYWSRKYFGPLTNRYEDTNFGIFSDTAESGVEWDRDSKLDIFFDHHGGLKIVDLVKGAGGGMNAWKVIGTGRWAGFGIRPNPVRTYKDMEEYKNGTLHFMYKGTNSFKVGIKSGQMAESWFSTSNLVKYGYKTDATNWQEVVIPLTECTNIDFKKISEYFLFSSEETDYTKGTVWLLDEIYWSKLNPYKKSKPSVNNKKKKAKK
jgi:hypothetical protein